MSQPASGAGLEPTVSLARQRSAKRRARILAKSDERMSLVAGERNVSEVSRSKSTKSAIIKPTQSAVRSSQLSAAPSAPSAFLASEPAVEPVAGTHHLPPSSAVAPQVASTTTDGLPAGENPSSSPQQEPDQTASTATKLQAASSTSPQPLLTAASEPIQPRHSRGPDDKTDAKPTRAKVVISPPSGDSAGASGPVDLDKLRRLRSAPARVETPKESKQQLQWYGRIGIWPPSMNTVLALLATSFGAAMARPYLQWRCTVLKQSGVVPTDWEDTLCDPTAATMEGASSTENTVIISTLPLLGTLLMGLTIQQVVQTRATNTQTKGSASADIAGSGNTNEMMQVLSAAASVGGKHDPSLVGSKLLAGAASAFATLGVVMRVVDTACIAIVCFCMGLSIRLLM